METETETETKTDYLQEGWQLFRSQLKEIASKAPGDDKLKQLEPGDNLVLDLAFISGAWAMQAALAATLDDRLAQSLEDSETALQAFYESRQALRNEPGNG